MSVCAMAIWKDRCRCRQNWGRYRNVGRRRYANPILIAGGAAVYGEAGVYESRDAIVSGAESAGNWVKSWFDKKFRPYAMFGHAERKRRRLQSR